jgi:hypothetical protein
VTCGPEPAFSPGQGRGAYRSRQPRPGHPATDLSHEQIKRQHALGSLISEYERAAQKRRDFPGAFRLRCYVPRRVNEF